MVSPYEATPRVRRPPVGREHVLSTPFAGGAWIRSLERSGQPDSAQAVAQINAMQVLDIVQMPAQRADEAIGEDRNAILGTLAVPDENRATSEVEILDPQSDAFHDAHPAAVQQLAEQAMDAAERAQQRCDFRARQDHRKPRTVFARATRSRNANSRSKTSR